MSLKMRETWLNKLAGRMAPWFAAQGYPLPLFRVSCGFPSSGRKGRAIGECWSDGASDDAHHEIFIHPSESNALEVAQILAHELIHAAVGLSHKHGGAFKQTAVKMGLVGKMTATIGGPVFLKWVKPLVRKTGPYPHATLNSGMGTSSKGPKEGTRMIKVICPTCGYTIRTTAKWLDQGLPVCPCGETMIVA